MSEAPPRELQLDDDLRQQRLEWRMQRIAWPLLVLLLVAIMLGLLGQGPLSRAQAGAVQAGITMDYHRFMRRLSAETLELQLQPGSERVRLRISGDYLDAVELERSFPEPEEVRAGRDDTTMVFRAQPGQPVVVRLEVKPKEMGTVDGWVAVDDGPRQRFSHFVYP